MTYDHWKATNPADEELCSCRLESVNSATIDPPEIIIDCHCPVHGDGGPDPDEAYDRMRDDANDEPPDPPGWEGGFAESH
jgi:hypothetical protein